MLDRITPVVLTKNEEANIGRTLRQLAWAEETIVVDSMSTDGTPDIARGFENVRLLFREIDSLAGQSTFGLDHVRTEWALLLDADYFLPDTFIAELAALQPGPSIDGYVAQFAYASQGRVLRASLYPPRLVLLRARRTRVTQDGHAHRIAVEEESGILRARIIHDDRKDFRRFISRQRTYMAQEAEKIRSRRMADLPLSGRIRKMIFVAPFAVVAHTLFFRGVIFDGWPGLVYALERFLAEALLSVELLRRPHHRHP